MKLKTSFGWALKNKKSGVLCCQFIFTSRTAARIKATEMRDTVAVRVKLEEAHPVCRSGCEMVDDVPVFCKRHAPATRDGIRDMLKGIVREELARCGIV